MPVVHREFGFRFIIYVDDHTPAHVHVEGNGGSAKIAIESAALVWSRGLGGRDVNRAVDIVRRERAAFGNAWKTVHG